jgi:hypothetical protein
MMRCSRDPIPVFTERKPVKKSQVREPDFETDTRGSNLVGPISGEQARPSSSQGSLADRHESYEKTVIASGMIPYFPDKSEYTYSFPRPITSKPSRFTINPQPDQTKYAGRPFKSATVDPKITEYQIRYTRPDGNKIDRFPWLKKL